MFRPSDGLRSVARPAHVEHASCGVIAHDGSASPPPVPPSVIELVGQVLAPALTLERELAVKANARVFRAFDQVTQQTVVVKVFFDAGIDSADAQRFQREIALAQALAHPGIVPILRWGREGRFVYYVMPFLPGGSLRDLIDRDGPLSLARTRALVAAVAEALAFAHARGIAHRDIKPGPILLDAEGRAFVSDLGIARAVGPADVGEGITSTGVTVGTPAYMSPEQAAADPRIDARTDQYALACVAFEMLTGAPPFLGAAPQDVLARHRLEQPPELRVVRPDVPASVEAAIRRALAKARAERFADIRAFADAFARDGSAWSATVGSTTTITRRAFGTSRVGLAMALLVLTAAIGALLVRRPVRAQVEALDPSRVAVFDFAAPADADALRALGTSLADALARRLAATQAITVLSRDAVRAMHERGQPLDSLVARLHPGSVIEGSLAQSAGRLHVEVRLVDAATQVLVASTTVERPIGEQFQLADELGETVVRLLRPRIGAEVESRTRSRGTDDAEARDLA
ncbi:MAG: protein kinase, partial [Gemmatimonadetes bacterium]|nr:protein kinase [Gemmatimonadota bacterium]